MKSKGFLQGIFDASSRYISGLDMQIERIGGAVADKYDEQRNPATFLYRGAELYFLSIAAGLAKAPALVAREGSRVLSKAAGRPLQTTKPTPPKP